METEETSDPSGGSGGGVSLGVFTNNFPVFSMG
jgi:hypothetical protein